MYVVSTSQTSERPAEEEQKEILQVISPDRNLTRAGDGDVILGAVRTLKSALMPLRRCYSLDLKGVFQMNSVFL